MKNKHCIILVSLLSICINLLAQSDQIIETYRNPVILGDFPDPTVIRVGNTYYAAGTTSDFAPNYPLYQSNDLINWTQIGSIFSEKPAWTTGAFWAPELFYNNGTFYVFYTAKRASDNESCIGVATSQDLSKGFTDHGILIEWGNEAIDAYVFEDMDGKFYITWKAYGLDPNRPIEILGSELNLKDLSLVGEHFTLTPHDQGWEGSGDEGQCIVKHGEYYYMFYSVGGCCDNRCTYAVQVSRSKDLKSGWVQYEGGSLMHGGEQWVCTGHGTLVETQDNRFFYLYHSYNATDFEFIGRQGMLDEVMWDKETGWPYFKYGPNPTLQAPVPFENTTQNRTTVFRDDFASEEIGKFWQWDLKGAKPNIEIKDNVLKLTNVDSNIAFLGMSPKAGKYTIETGIENKSQNAKGLCIYGDQSHLLGFGVAGSTLILFQINEGKKSILAENKIDSNIPVYLKAEAINGRFFQFYWSTNQETWNTLEMKNTIVDGSFLPRWGVAMRVGLMVENNEDNIGVFSYFEINNQF